VRASHRFAVVDVFTDEPLQGNQLAVFTDARSIPEELLLPLARETRFSECVFVYPPSGDGHVRIRTFTPVREIPYAGHPTLGTAFLLGAPMQLEEIRLETGIGVVAVRLERDADRLVFGRMQQPVPAWEPYARAEALLAGLRVARSELPVDVYDSGVRHVFVVLPGRDDVAALEPDLAALARHGDVLGINCVAGGGAEWKLRMFAPAWGMTEDAATGSAAGPLAVHLARHGLIAWGDGIRIEQGVEIGRRSALDARAEGTAERVERVEVGGSAVVVARGEFRV